MIKIALVDDDPVFLTALSDLVLSSPAWEGARPLVKTFGSAAGFLRAFEAAPFDLVILDVIMPELSGVEIARLIYEFNPATVLAFVSGSPELAHSGYGVDAVAYLLKPVEAAGVQELIREALDRRTRRGLAYLSLRVGRTFIRIYPENIVFLESDNKQVHFHLLNRCQTYAGKLDFFLEQLPAAFVRVHKSYAVNLDQVVAMRPSEMITRDGRSVPISRKYRVSAEKAYLKVVADEVKAPLRPVVKTPEGEE